MIMAVALIVLGPKKLPELAKKLGETIREFRSATDSFKSTMDAEIHRPAQAAPSPNSHMTSSEPQALPEPGEVAEIVNSEQPAEVLESTPGQEANAAVAAAEAPAPAQPEASVAPDSAEGEADSKVIPG